MAIVDNASRLGKIDKEYITVQSGPNKCQGDEVLQRHGVNSHHAVHGIGGAMKQNKMLTPHFQSTLRKPLPQLPLHSWPLAAWALTQCQVRLELWPPYVDMGKSLPDCSEDLLKALLASPTELEVKRDVGLLGEETKIIEYNGETPSERGGTQGGEDLLEGGGRDERKQEVNVRWPPLCSLIISISEGVYTISVII
jgi:hypothetical protein